MKARCMRADLLGALMEGHVYEVEPTTGFGNKRLYDVRTLYNGKYLGNFYKDRFKVLDEPTSAVEHGCFICQSLREMQPSLDAEYRAAARQLMSTSNVSAVDIDDNAEVKVTMFGVVRIRAYLKFKIEDLDQNRFEHNRQLANAYAKKDRP